MSGFNLSEWALKHRSITIYLMILAVIAGLASYYRLGRSEDPSFIIKTMVVQAQWPGATTEEMIHSVKRGLYAVHFGGGQVDITSGKFVFAASEAYLIEDGRVTAPVKGATLIGSGPEAMNQVSMIGNDMRLDPGVGTCGKDGQSVPVGVGQPTLRIDGLTVGGTV